MKRLTRKQFIENHVDDFPIAYFYRFIMCSDWERAVKDIISKHAEVHYFRNGKEITKDELLEITPSILHDMLTDDPTRRDIVYKHLDHVNGNATFRVGWINTLPDDEVYSRLVKHYEDCGDVDAVYILEEFADPRLLFGFYEHGNRYSEYPAYNVPQNFPY